jgi:hypothetical protein
MIAVASVNILILVRFKHSKPVVLFHVASLHLISGLFCLLMESAILDLRIERFYSAGGRLLLYLSIALYAVVAIAYYINRKKLTSFPAMDLRSAFQTVDDLTIVADYTGRIVDINHREAFTRFNLDADTLQNLLYSLWKLSGSQDLDGIAVRLLELKEKVQTELLLSRYEQWYALSILPILSGGECLGFIMILQDVTYIKTTKDKLQTQNAAIEETNRQLARDAHMAGILEAEKQRLQVQEKVQSEILKQIEYAITDVGAMLTFYKETGRICRDDAAALAERLRSIHKDVRQSIGAISGRSESI